MSITPNLGWTQKIDTYGKRNYTYALSSDLQGSIFSVSGSINLDNARERDSIISKYSQSGELLWRRTISGSGENSGYGAATALDGSLYVVGRTESSLDNQIHSGGMDAFITKYNAKGEKIWTKILGTNSWDEAQGVAIGTDGFLYVAGTTSGNLDGQINSVGGHYESFLAKYDINGEKIWARLLGERSYSGKVITGYDGSVYLGGSTTFNYDGDAFVAKFNADGEKLWTTRFGTTSPPLMVWSAKARSQPLRSVLPTPSQAPSWPTRSQALASIPGTLATASSPAASRSAQTVLPSSPSPLPQTRPPRATKS